jgi:hypothetical protein
VGDSGTAKSVTISAFLAGLDQFWPATSRTLGFSSRTSSMDVQRAIEDCVEKRTKVGGPRRDIRGWEEVDACARGGSWGVDAAQAQFARTFPGV